MCGILVDNSNAHLKKDMAAFPCAFVYPVFVAEKKSQIFLHIPYFWFLFYMLRRMEI